MKTLTLLAALVTAVMLIIGPAFAQGTKADCQPSASPGSAATKPPAKIEGEVTKVDKKNGTLTVKAPDGSTQEFRGSADTVKEYKKGDKIELTLRGC